MDYKEFKEKFHINLNSQQEAAVQKVYGPILLRAVPGSGKTTVMVTRLGYMHYCCNIRPEEILTMTYTRAATHDMQERFCSFFGKQLSDVLQFRTINAISGSIITYCEKTKKEQAFKLIPDDGTQSKVIGDIYFRIAAEYATESDIKAIQTQITYIKNKCLTEKEIAELKLDNGIKVSSIYQEYRDIMRKHHWMDFDDQMVYAYKIFQHYPEILRHFQQKYHYFCVDEAQDTSKIQHLLIRKLASAEHNLFMVGDEDQSIYGFRAAYPEALMEFKRVYPSATELLMEKNYRTTGQIVQQADRFIQQNKSRHPKHMITDNEPGSPIHSLLVNDRIDQYRYIAQLALKCDTETAILYRDNDSAIPIIDILNRQRVGYRCRQVESTFFSHRIVKDISEMIRFAYDQIDGGRFLSIYYKFNAGISKAMVTSAKRASEMNGTAVLDELLRLDLSDRCSSQVKHLKNSFISIQAETAAEAIHRLVSFMGYGDYLKQHHIDQSKILILEILAEQEQEQTPKQFLSRLNELKQIVSKGSTDPQSRLILSTIHSSKGLEYERVILADVIDGILPRVIPSESTPVEKAADLEEERRLFYVAMTRAKHELTIVRFKKYGLVSSFVNALFSPPPKPAPTSPKSKPILKPETSAAIPMSKPISDTKLDPPKNFTLIAKKYKPQTCVIHKKYGSGVLLARNRDIIIIRFDNGVAKKFNVITELQAGILSLK